MQVWSLGVNAAQDRLVVGAAGRDLHVYTIGQVEAAPETAAEATAEAGGADRMGNGAAAALDISMQVCHTLAFAA